MFNLQKNAVSMVAIASLFVGSLIVSGSANAASQCSGLSSSVCSSKSDECTWRKSSVDKNGKKTKSHCRALPGKSKKTTSKTKASSTKSLAKKTKSDAKSKTTKSTKVNKAKKTTEKTVKKKAKKTVKKST